jgi:acyl-CoA synthetase (AMP-forming)/AMP-acid ligase II
MTAPDRTRTGVSEEMIAVYGDRIWDLSTNMQVRIGDPVRRLDLAEIERQKPGMGMADYEIAATVGLTTEQVRAVRTTLERRRFHTGHYRRLFEIGPGQRFRQDRYVPDAERFQFRPEALALRQSLNFDPRNAGRYLKDGLWTGDTVSAWLTKWAGKTPERVAIRWAGGALTYSETLDKAQRFAAALLDLGIRKGDVVAIQLANVPEFVIAYFGVTMMGGVLSPLHMPYRAGEMRPLLNHASARAAICAATSDSYDAPATFLSLKGQVPTLEHVIVVGNAPDGTLSFDALIGSTKPRQIDNPPVAADPTVLCFTSGTSSEPKAVVHTYQTMLSNNRLCAPVYGLAAEDVLLAGPPFTHGFGICMINYILNVGGTNLLMPQFTPQVLAELLERQKPTVFYCAPAHVAACWKGGLFDGRTFPSVRVAIISGSPCAPEIADALAAVLPNAKVGQMWGMTEMFMGLITTNDQSREIRHNTLGGASPGTEVRLTRADGALAPDGEDGEIEVRGCSVFAGYFNNAAANRIAFAGDGWFKTGDLARRRPDGAYQITGRVKDIINRGGIKINPIDIEALIDRHPAVLQSAIAPVPDPVLGEKACLFVVPKPGKSLTLAEATDYLANNGIAKMRWPERLEIIDAMPMTPTRKIVKRELTQRLTR